MKKRIILICVVLFTFVSKESKACDICGCGAGGYYIGLLPDFNQQVVGIRYRGNALQTHLNHQGERSVLTRDELYHTLEVWGGITIKDKMRILAYVPYNFNIQMEDGIKEQQSGIGDPAIQGFYRLLRKTKTTDKNQLMVNEFWLGGGVKLPFGKYEQQTSVEEQGVNLFQLGTGSLDFLITGMYDLRIQDFGVHLNASYKLNTTNRDQYYYGNRISATVQAYRKFRLNSNWMIAPNLGVGTEYSSKDFDHGYSILASGGHAVFGVIGTEINFKKMAIGGQYQFPFYQKMANNTVKIDHKWMMHLSYTF